jgi:hypothetical protein
VSRPCTRNKTLARPSPRLAGQDRHTPIVRRRNNDPRGHGNKKVAHWFHPFERGAAGLFSRAHVGG